jgi:hypothetical protein
MQYICSHPTIVIYDAIGALLPIGKRLYVNGYWTMAVLILVSTLTATREPLVQFLPLCLSCAAIVAALANIVGRQCSASRYCCFNYLLYFVILINSGFFLHKYVFED